MPNGVGTRARGFLHVTAPSLRAYDDASIARLQEEDRIGVSVW